MYHYVTLCKIVRVALLQPPTVATNLESLPPCTRTVRASRVLVDCAFTFCDYVTMCNIIHNCLTSCNIM